MTVPHRTLWVILLALTLVGASCTLSIPGFGNVVFGPSEAPDAVQPTATPPAPAPATDTPLPPPTDTPLPAVSTPTPTPQVVIAATPTPTPPVEALLVTPTATLSLIEVTPETGWPVAPLTLALAAAGSGLLAILAGWVLRRPPT